jgi:Glycosyl hydrolase family 26
MRTSWFGCIVLLNFVSATPGWAFVSSCLISGPRYQLATDVVEWSMKIGSGQTCTRGFRFSNVVFEHDNLVSAPQSGELTLQGPSFTYTARSDFQGQDSFAISVSGSIKKIHGSSTIHVAVLVGATPATVHPQAQVGLAGQVNAANDGPLLGMSAYDAPVGPANNDLRSAWLNRPLMMAYAVGGPVNWTGGYNINWQLGPWQTWVNAVPGRVLYYTASMLGSGQTLQGCAAGQYNRSTWVPFARSFTGYNFPTIIVRVGHEMTGNWYPWSALGNEAAFVGCYQQIVNTLRSTQPNIKWQFDWNPIPATSTAELSATYPGDSYVDYVTTDAYDVAYGPGTYPYPVNCNQTCLSAAQAQNWSYLANYLATISSFTKTHGKKMGIPEWGLWQAPYQYGAGGDDPYYIQQMYLWIMNPANNVAYQSYFDLATDANHEVYPPTSYPRGSAEYQQLFGLQK